MKVLWHSNAPWSNTGYGNQTNLYVPRLKAGGHEVAVSAFYGLAGHVLNWLEGIRVFPCGNHPYGADMVGVHAKVHQSDVVVTLMDVWVLFREMMAELPWAAWCPVDHEPLPPAVKEMLEVCRWPIAMSRFGQAMMEQAGLKAFYIPHGVESKDFKPMDRAEARGKLRTALAGQIEDEALGDETFLVAMVAANKGMPSRKAFPEVLTAWKIFQAQHRNAHLYLHTEKSGVQGVNFEALLHMLDIPAESVSFVPQYAYDMGDIGSPYLNWVYNAADVLLNPSYGEGFGIPIVEAQMAGCPVIVGDNTAMRELCGAGWKVKGAPLVTPMYAWQFRPIETEIVRALEEALEARGDAGLREQARAFALGYDADRVYAEHWKPTLEAIGAELAEEKAAADAVKIAIGGNGHSSIAEKREQRKARRAEVVG